MNRIEKDRKILKNLLETYGVAEINKVLNDEEDNEFIEDNDEINNYVALIVDSSDTIIRNANKLLMVDFIPDVNIDVIIRANNILNDLIKKIKKTINKK